MIKTPVKRVMLSLAISSLMFLGSCKEDVDPAIFSTALLTDGDWLLTEVDDQPYDDLSTVIYSFETSGKVETCIEYVDYPELNECDNGGDWAWEDDTQSAIRLTDARMQGDDEGQLWNVIILDETKLVVEVPPVGTSVKFIKVI